MTKPSLLILLTLAAGCLSAHAGPFSSIGGEEKVKLLHAALAQDKDTPPATTFPADVAKIYAFWIGDALKSGDQLRAVWTAEDVGAAAPKETKIDEATMTADKADDQGAFSLSRPDKGWPLGKYRVEIYDGETLAATLKFTIHAAE